MHSSYRVEETAARGSRRKVLGLEYLSAHHSSTTHAAPTVALPLMSRDFSRLQRAGTQ